MSTSLLDAFTELDDAQKEIIADLDSPRLLAFAALQIAHEECGAKELSVEHILACLEAAGVAVRKLSLMRALASAHGLVSSRRDDAGVLYYKLMTKGRRELGERMGANRMSVMKVEKGQPRTARLMLGEVLAQVSGVARICDPYYGVKTLDSLDLIPKATQIRFLTLRCNEEQRKVQGALRDFKAERPTVEFRIAPNNAGIHDRYVVGSDVILLLGHGLKDIGGKESFVIRLEKSLVPDLVKNVSSSFDSLWALSTPIPI